MDEQGRIASGTNACDKEYVQESFQLTLNEVILGIRYTEVPERFSENENIPPVNLTVIDGELFLVRDEPPPGLIPFPENAGLLLAAKD